MTLDARVRPRLEGSYSHEWCERGIKAGGAGHGCAGWIHQLRDRNWSAAALTQPEGEKVADFISFNRDSGRELLSMHSSRAVNLSWKFTAPDTLYSNRTREMWKIEEDLTRENYCGGGFCSEHLNVARYGEAGKGAPNCQSNL